MGRLMAAGLLCVALAGCGGGSADDAGAPILCATCIEQEAASGGLSANAPAFVAFSRSGTGADSFVLPADVTAIRIRAATAANSANFVVHADGRLLVNEIVGATQSPPAQDGTYPVSSGATLAVTLATEVNWSITSVRIAAAPATTLLSVAGVGANLVNLPARTSTYQIRANNTGASENFVVWVGDRLVVNEIIGTSSLQGLQGNFVLSTGQAVISTGSGVTWSIVELQ